MPLVNAANYVREALDHKGAESIEPAACIDDFKSCPFLQAFQRSVGTSSIHLSGACCIAGLPHHTEAACACIPLLLVLLRSSSSAVWQADLMFAHVIRHDVVLQAGC